MTFDDIDAALLELHKRIVALSVEYMRFIRLSSQWWRYAGERYA